MLRLAFATAITLQKTAVLARVPLRYTATMNALPKNVSSFLPQKMYTGEQVTEHEAAAAASEKIAMFDLMDAAGKAAYDAMRSQASAAQTIAVVAGKGNNGGDGYIMARYALADHLKPTVYQIGDPSELKGDAARARDAYTAQGGRIVPVHDADFELSTNDVIVDAIFGIGLSRAINKEPYLSLIRQINSARDASKSFVFAVDIPSGILAGTGKVAGVAVKADATCTFIALKQGLLTGDAPEHTGQLLHAPLGLQTRFEDIVRTNTMRVSYAILAQAGMLPLRPANGHKGTFGKAIIIGGGMGTSGAIRMAGEACQRTGVGLLRVLTHSSCVSAVSIGRPEMMVEGYNLDNIKDIKQYLSWASVVGIGPGLGQDDWGQAMLKETFEHISSDTPMVVDADGLNLVSKLSMKRDNWILTPHPGEAATLLGCSSAADVEKDRFRAVKLLHERYGGVILLKGAGTVIYDGGDTFVVSDGNPGMASGGMGDTLTGIITGVLAQGLSLSDAAKLGACLHAAAADRVANEYGERGMLASDLLPHLRQLVNPLRRVRLPKDQPNFDH